MKDYYRVEVHTYDENKYFQDGIMGVFSYLIKLEEKIVGMKYSEDKLHEFSLALNKKLKEDTQDGEWIRIVQNIISSICYIPIANQPGKTCLYTEEEFFKQKDLFILLQMIIDEMDLAATVDVYRFNINNSKIKYKDRYQVTVNNEYFHKIYSDYIDKYDDAKSIYSYA